MLINRKVIIIIIISIVYNGIRSGRVVSVGDLEPGVQISVNSHGGYDEVPLCKSHFLAWYRFVYPGIVMQQFSYSRSLSKHTSTNSGHSHGGYDGVPLCKSHFLA